MNPLAKLMLVSGVILAFSPSLKASDSLDKLSDKLIQLRGEVEQLNDEIHFLKQEHKQDMNFLWTQKNEVKSEIERNAKLIARLQEDLDKKISENESKGQSSEELKPSFKAAMLEIDSYLEKAIPFKKVDRKAALNEIDEQVFQNLITVQRGFNKLWAFLEDEIRLTKETGLYQQSILIDGKDSKQLVDIARIGMMSMYFKTADNEVGQLTGEPNAWHFELLSEPQEVKDVDYLFEALQKQIRTGLFTLPTKPE